MAARDALLDLARVIGLMIDEEEIEVSEHRAFLHRPLIHKVKGMIFSITHFSGYGWGEATAPTVSWQSQHAAGYTDEDLEAFLQVICHQPQFSSALDELAKVEKRSRDTGMLLLYLTCFSYHVELALLKDRWASTEPIVDAFLQDLEADDLRIVTTFGLRGIATKEEIIRINDGVVLRRLAHSDYHDVFEPLGDRLAHRVPFPLSIDATSVLEVSSQLKGRLDGIYALNPFFPEVRERCSIREFDIVISQVLQHVWSWMNLFWLVQNESNPKIAFERVELHLPKLSPNQSVYRYERKEGAVRGSAGVFLVQEADKQTFELMSALFAREYSKVLWAYDGRETPLSLAYSRYQSILGSSESYEARIQHEVEALEAFFTPESDKRKVFINRLVYLIRALVMDENDTENLLRNAYGIRNSRVHRGEGWDEFHPLDFTTDLAKYYWEKYAAELSVVLLTYLRLSIVSRILSRVDEKSYIVMLDRSISTGKVDESLVGQTKFLSRRIERINDFLAPRKASLKYEIPLPLLFKSIEKKELDAIILDRIGGDGRAKKLALIPERALEQKIIDWK